MKKVQNFYLYSYRLVGFIFLLSLILAIIWYGFSLLFFITSNTWSIPLILSPNQEKVMAHLEHVMVFEQELTKNKAELIAGREILNHKKILLATNNELLARLNLSMHQQAKLANKASKTITKLNKAQIKNMQDLKHLALQSKNENELIDEELKIGLITKQEALIAHLSWSKLFISLNASKANVFEFKERAREFDEAAKTLLGDGSHLKWMNKIIKKVEMENLILQLKSDIAALNIGLDHLKKNIAKKTKVLQFMKKSPYIKSTKNAVTVAFVPYSNLAHIKIGSPVYSCYLELILCYKSGKVTEIYNGEEYFTHPIFKSDLKGQLIEVNFDNIIDSQKKLLFINAKPLLI